MDIKIWKDLLNLESDDYFIMIKNSIEEEFYLNDMNCLDKMYEIKPYLKNWKLDNNSFFIQGYIYSKNAKQGDFGKYLTTHFLYDIEGAIKVLEKYGFGEK